MPTPGAMVIGGRRGCDTGAMSSDRRSLRLPFSEPPADVPVQADLHRLPPAEQTPFQQPPALDPDVPAQATGRRNLAAGGLTFSAPERQG